MSNEMINSDDFNDLSDGDLDYLITSTADTNKNNNAIVPKNTTITTKVDNNTPKTSSLTTFNNRPANCRSHTEYQSNHYNNLSTASSSTTSGAAVDSLTSINNKYIDSNDSDDLDDYIIDKSTQPIIAGSARNTTTTPKKYKYNSTGLDDTINNTNTDNKIPYNENKNNTSKTTDKLPATNTASTFTKYVEINLDQQRIDRSLAAPTHHQLAYDELPIYIYPTNFPIRDYQVDIVQKSLFQNVLATIPTGTGKTFIASTVMLNYYRWTSTKDSKIIFMAPTRPLVAQQIKACLGITGIPYDDTAILLDKSRKNRETIWETKKVFFTTPQVVENDLKRGVLNPKHIILLVIDEAHRARGSYAYVNVVSFIKRFSTSFRVLALTATPAQDLEGVQEIVNNLSISKIELRTEKSEDVSKYMKTRDVVKQIVPLNEEMADIIEKIGVAILPVLQEANECNLYDDTDPSRINSFVALNKSQKVIANPTLPEGLKWKYYFILQLLSHVGQMLKRLKIYGIRVFYNYFQDKLIEFKTKYDLGKSTNKTAASFYYNPILTQLKKDVERLLLTRKYDFLGHDKLQHVKDELTDFFHNNTSGNDDRRVIIFTELRESALEIVKIIDSMNDEKIRSHIFIGQSKGKEGFDDVKFTLKHKKKGKKLKDRLEYEKEKVDYLQSKKDEQKQAKELRSSSRTCSSEEAQLSGMNQKQQKQVINDFKKGIYNVIVCTSIGEEGLDIGEVDLIICYDSTSSPIKNIQRMGRTGRKRDGKILLLLSSNENKKFEQSMSSYYALQDLIASGDRIEYQKSDRIIPNAYNPQCQYEFIDINETNDEVNHLETMDEVIKFATQAMLGKIKPLKSTTVQKNNKRKNIDAGNTKKRQKQFFMPDNVETGIISAIKMVEKKNCSNINLDVKSNGSGIRRCEISSEEEEEEEEEANERDIIEKFFKNNYKPKPSKMEISIDLSSESNIDHDNTDTSTTTTTSNSSQLIPHSKITRDIKNMFANTTCNNADNLTGAKHDIIPNKALDDQRLIELLDD
ncbi:related to ATP-dependent DNA helicase MPH1 [Saccharomycodes ludwigii]|uniref:ATP-dependent DNA helicase n=1 Tax=Saccharomycodes ludwigii TaxID=36035 RepID=A0A376BAD6_9ASCO|nr:related to ATP-dependent DNA helicase MPH1 [Saccharomycodes ludwigii]